MDRRALSDEEFTMIAMAVQKVFGMKDPYPSTMKIVKSFPGNGCWLMFNLARLDRRIANGQYPTIKSKWAYLDALRKLNTTLTAQSCGGDDLAWDDGKEIKDWYHLICPATYGGHPDVVHVGGFINAVVAYAEHMKKGGK